MWNADRSMYYGTKEPDVFESILLEAHAKIHWLRIRTAQNLRSTYNSDKEQQ
jgi:hypothetical protein